SAAAAGIRQIYCSGGCVQCWTPKVLRAGMGAHFLLNIYEGVDLQELITQAHIPVLATSSHAAAVVYDMPLAQPHAWVFGNEGQGVAPHLLDLVSNTVALPHIGAMESLNVAACAAICLFEQLRQRRG
ncbi:MAG: RNA methyltransferase, partial [Burkholderiales bacterium]|nr:RNA methyltransferase [Burkholderiales bacterium]